VSATEQKAPTPVQTLGAEVGSGRTLDIRMGPDTLTQESVTGCELNLLEGGEYALADTEPEEYETELEERLFPLDEVELWRRMKNNRWLLEPSQHPNIGLTWNGEKLPTIEEAKRSNREFRRETESRVSSSVTPKSGKHQHYARGVAASALPAYQVNISEEDAKAREPEVLQNVCVGLEDVDSDASDEVELGSGGAIPL
ncbi:hypothetical protein PI124_g22786, partial [Phytophthora idaei]